MLTREQLLPDHIPPGLDARACYELGLRYRLAGHVRRAKEAFNKVCELASCSEYARKSHTILKTQLPLVDVPETAEQRNIRAYNLMESDPASARKIFQELMAEYPDFEWPFSNYAWMLVSDGDLVQARSLAKYLLSLNPFHLRSIHLSMQIALMEGNMEEALVFAERGEQASEGDSDFKELVQAIILHRKGAPPDTIPEQATAEEYLDLARRYEMFGRLSMAQQAVAKCLATDGAGDIAARALKFSRSHLPCKIVTRDAENRLVDACNLRTTEPGAARDALKQLLEDYPGFENAAVILASFYFQDKELLPAEQYTRAALSINPHSEPAKLFLLQLHMMQEHFEEALAFIESAFPDAAERTISMDLMKAQCELAVYRKQRNLHR